MSSIKIPHIPSLINVEQLINGELPPSVFLLVPTKSNEPGVSLDLKIEQFVHIDILPDDLKAKVKEEVRPRAARYRAIMEGKTHLLIQRFTDREGTTFAIAPQTKLPEGVQPSVSRIFVAHGPEGLIAAQEKSLVGMLMGCDANGFTWEFVSNFQGEF